MCNRSDLPIDTTSRWRYAVAEMRLTINLTRVTRCALLALAAVALAACGSDEGAGAATPLGSVEPPAEPSALGEIAVSTPVLADIVANVVGGRAEVWSVVPPGADPHTFEPAPRDLVRASSADLFIQMGANLEEFARTGAWRGVLRDAQVPVLTYADHMDLIVVDRVIDHGDHTHDLTGGDPHVWLDPLRAIELVDITVSALSSMDPAAAAFYRSNGDAYQADLSALHEEYLAALERIPEERRRLIVFHDAYTYFEERYGFEVIGVVISNPQAEPSARDVAELNQLVRDAGLNVVFKEPQYDAAILDQLARDQGIAVGVLMTDTFTDEVQTYLDLLRFNLRSLQQHLAS